MTTFKWNYMSALQHITYQTITNYSFVIHITYIQCDVFNYWYALIILLQVNIILKWCVTLPHQWGGRQGEWTIGTSSLQSRANARFGFRQSTWWWRALPDVGNWNQFPISRNWWLPDIEKWFSEKNSRYSDINKCCSTYEHIHVFA